MEELERVYVVPLRKAFEKPRIKRAKVAAKLLRSFISRHMKVLEPSVKLSSSTNSALLGSGIKKPPRRVKVAANRDKDGKVLVSLVGEKEEADARAKRRAERSKRKAEQKKSKHPKRQEPKEGPKQGPVGEETKKQGEETKEPRKEHKRKKKPKLRKKKKEVS